MSGWFDSFNQAVGFTEDPADSANKAIKAQSAAEDRRAQLAEDQFAYQRRLSDPFLNSSLPAYYSLVASITGQPQSYDPYATKEGYTRLSPEEAQSLANGWEYATQIEHGKPHGYMKNVRSGELVKMGNDLATQQAWIAAQPDYKTVDPNKTYYRDPNGQLVEGTMQTVNPFNPTETEAYKWKQQQMEKNTNRTLRSLGRANSTYGMNAIGDQNRNLASTEYDTQLGRLADLTNIARGGASSLANASTGFSNQQQQGLTNMGNNVANASLAGGMMRQNSMYNNQQNAMGLANLGLKAYDAWGKGGDSGGWGSSNGTIDNYDANTTYAGDSPGPWAG